MIYKLKKKLPYRAQKAIELFRELKPIQTVGGVITPNDIQMDYSRLGRTNLRVSAMTLGAGGPSKLGRNTGKSQRQAKALIKRAYELGINIFDTSHDYGNEKVLGTALKDVPREKVVLSSKCRSRKNNQRVSAQRMRQCLEQSLRNLNTDYLDIYHVASVRPEDYDYVVQELLPTLQRFQQEGKVRFLGISEKFDTDTQHEMLARAVTDGLWDVIMLGFNLLNQTARKTVLPIAQQNDIGVMNMFAVRRSLRSAATLRSAFEHLSQQGYISSEHLSAADPLAFILGNGEENQLTDIAYRYCRHEPGIHTVMSGTGDISHLESNILSILSPALPPQQVAQLNRLFESVTQFSGN